VGTDSKDVNCAGAEEFVDVGADTRAAVELVGDGSGTG
jgi:hypothetical protein